MVRARPSLTLASVDAHSSMRGSGDCLLRRLHRQPPEARASARIRAYTRLPPLVSSGLLEREIIAYCGTVQLRWNIKQAKAAWEALSLGEGAPAAFDGVAIDVGGCVRQHMTVGDDIDMVALEGEVVKSLRF